MDAEDSIVVQEFTKRFNAALSEGIERDQIDVSTIVGDIFRHFDMIPATLENEIRTTLIEAMVKQEQAAQNLRGDLKRDWGQAFDAMDISIAYAIFLNSRLLEVIFKRYETLKRKDPRFKASNPAVTGAALKCFLLVSLLGRSCAIASEISCLPRSRLLGGAQSRIRSLHEQTVVITLLYNDHTYEVAERYHDHASYEALQELRSLKRVLAEPIWEENPGRDEKLVQEISEAKRHVRAARSRWGSDIMEQYGWARPALPDDISRRRKITFVDLERGVKGGFLRGDYVRQNNQVHAGAYAAITHFFSGSLNTCGQRDDDIIRITASRTAAMLTFSSQEISKAISWETEEYDEMLYSLEMSRLEDETQNQLDASFKSVMLSSGTSELLPVSVTV